MRFTTVSLSMLGLGCSLLMMVVACEKKETSPGSCYRMTDNACAEYTATEAAAGKRLCSGMTWTAGANSCPSSNRVGTCVRRAGAADERSEWLYSGAPNNYSASGAKSACESVGGTFTASPPSSPAPPSAP